MDSIDIRAVTVGGEIGRRISVTVDNNLLRLNLDGDFLQPFREKKQHGGYIGLGKLIDSVARLAAHTGDARLIELRRRLLAETLSLQLPDGYLGLMAPEDRMWTLWDLHEMSYLIYGLVADHHFFGEEQSLKSAIALADYILTQWAAKPNSRPGEGFNSVEMGTCGFERAMFAVSDATGEARYAEFAEIQRGIPQWDREIVQGRHGLIEGHAYAYFARCLAQLDIYRKRPDDALLRQTRRVLDFLLKQEGLTITGGCGQWECWHDDQDGGGELGETCATAYFVRLLGVLLQMERKSCYGDLMERTIYNALFAAQTPNGRQIRYYSPFEGRRPEFELDTYCCPNNYRRIVSELPGLLYYRAQDGVAINIYAQSSAKTALPDGQPITIRQETDYPNSGQVAIHLDFAQPAAFALHLRIPKWCDMAKAVVNDGELEASVAGGSFFTLRRQWKPGDVVHLDMPMPWRLIKGRRSQTGRVAVMRGPMVFCLNPRLNNLSGVDLRRITIDPASLEGPLPDDTVHPNGIACRLRAWGPAGDTSLPPTLSLLLTELPDPEGEMAYFHLPKPGAGVADELIG